VNQVVPEDSLEGWSPEVSEELPLAAIVDFAFDYRGNVTLVMRDGAQRSGFVSNRDSRAAEPFLQLFDEEGNGPFRIAYADVLTIRFSGRDTAAGTSWKAWVERREAAKRAAASDAPGADPHRG
jgi:hypothetical protein